MVVIVLLYCCFDLLLSEIVSISITQFRLRRNLRALQCFSFEESTKM